MTEQQRLAERMAKLPSYVIKAHDIARDFAMSNELWELSNHGQRMSDEECRSMADDIARACDHILDAGESLDRIQNILEQQLNDIGEEME